MKFISRMSNLNIILKPGIPASPITGTPEVPTIFVKFRDGIAVVEDEALIQLMLNHKNFNSDFIAAEDTQPDPYAYQRISSEPVHTTTEIKYGTPQKRTAPPVAMNLSPEIQQLIAAKAMEIAMEMLPKMVEAGQKAAPAAEVKESEPELVETQEVVEEPVTQSQTKTASKPKTK